MQDDKEQKTSCSPDQCGSCGEASCASRQQAAPQHAAPAQDDAKLKARLNRIRRKIIVMSGKGGVGKSTVAVNLAMSAMLAGQRVGLLDVDLHGPSVPTMLGLVGYRLEGGENGMLPVEIGGLKVLSVGFLLQNNDDPVIWRGPMKMGVIRQFIEDVEWGDLDLLVIDVPPGTGDEPLSVCQLIPELEGAVIVTTPQKVAAADVRKSINFCKELGVKVLGVIENMSGFACPKCGEVTPILRANGGRVMANEMGVPFLGSIPIDPLIAESGDDGKAFVESAASSPAAGAFREIVRELTV
ncbi:MAG: Mrp/NBP35 family ATP-binding protein [Kiritimatiellae bacterium]|jgi:Mrp family chromosome partitioning ATPase|nr:Mrp/NBP35 family ATP-binding protein [Kiritimatiellia bacterium]